MKFIKKNAVFTLYLIYLLFTQVYPYIHIHLGKSADVLDITFYYHPVDACPFEHEGFEEHHHEMRHVQGDWQHISPNIDAAPAKIICITWHSLEDGLHPCRDYSIVHRLGRHHFTQLIITTSSVNRAPPFNS